MIYDFDEEIDRRGSGCLKYDKVEKKFGVEAFPLWVADMDFATPYFILDAMKERLNHPIFGYSFEDIYPSIKIWMKRRFDYKLAKNSYFIDHSVMGAINLAINAFSQKGDGVIVQSPGYFPFYDSVTSNDRVLLENKLVLKNNRYEIDFEDLKIKAQKAKILLLCSPHNPIGRVWNEDELTQIAQIAQDNDLVIISDEVHSDLVLPGNKFFKIATYAPNHTISITSICKTFNVASLPSSITMIEDKKLREKYRNLRKRLHIDNYNILVLKAIKSAYENGEEWLAQLLKYLDENLKFIDNFLKINIPEIKLIKPEATYLLWLDMRDLNIESQKLQEILLKDAKVAMYEGSTFGIDGDGFFRMNIATQRQNIENVLNRIYATLR